MARGAPYRPAADWNQIVKKMIVGAVAVGAVVMATAAVADMPEQVLSIRRLTVGDSVEVALPTIQKSDGSVCMAYAADVSRDSLGKITVKVGEICGKEGVAKVNERGGIEMWPSNLRVLHSEVRHGLTMEVPHLVGDVAK